MAALQARIDRFYAARPTHEPNRRLVARGLTLRADSGFYAGAVISACRRADVRSVTARKNVSIRRAIEAIPDDAWTPIPYWLDGGADVAETTYTAFAGTPHEVTCRLLVRRVRRTPDSQLAMDVVFEYHAILTDRDGALLDVEADDRRHAVVEHVVADLKHHAASRTCRRDASRRTPLGWPSSASPTTSRAGPPPPPALAA